MSINDPPTRSILAVILAFAVIGFVDEYFYLFRQTLPGAWVGVSTVTVSVLIFAWYYFDARARSYRRSPALNVLVVAFAIVAVPYYLVRSREKGQRAGALFGLLGVLVLAFASYALGSACAHLL
jgi:hypothetical protein